MFVGGSCPRHAYFGRPVCEPFHVSINCKAPIGSSRYLSNKIYTMASLHIFILFNLIAKQALLSIAFGVLHSAFYPLSFLNSAIWTNEISFWTYLDLVHCSLLSFKLCGVSIQEFQCFLEMSFFFTQVCIFIFYIPSHV